MKIHLLTLFGLVLLVSVSRSEEPQYDFELFDREIVGKCLQNLWTNINSDRNVHLKPQTLDTFISIVEEVENNNRNWSIYQVSRALLKRFAFEGIVFVMINGKPEAVQGMDARSRWDIISKLVGSGPETLDEDSLDDEKKCSMYFMMGHVINDTYREGYDEEVVHSQVPPKNKMRMFESYSMVAKEAREQGVISVNGRQYSAVAISMVLNAILASERDDDKDIKVLLGIRNSKFPNGKMINPLIGVTLGDVISMAARSSGQSFGPGGYWYPRDHPTEFRLAQNYTESTVSLLQGAVDGVLIGKALMSYPARPQNRMRLSSFLRMYYSKRGLPRHGLENVSYCKRDDALAIVSQSVLSDSAEAFYMGRMYVQHSKITDPGALIKHAIDNIIHALKDIEGDSECSQSSE